MGPRRELAACSVSAWSSRKPRARMRLDPVFRRLAVDVMIALLPWLGVRHQHRLLRAMKDRQEVVEETRLDVLDEFAGPDDIGVADFRHALWSKSCTRMRSGGTMPAWRALAMPSMPVASMQQWSSM